MRMYVCMYVCVYVCSTSFGALKGRLKWSNLSEIWYTYSLGESMGVFFPFLKNFDLRAQGTQPWTLNGPKTFGAYLGRHK